MTHSYMYILKDGVPVPEDDPIIWGKWFQDAEERRVAFTTVGHVTISTVFLGLDHSFSGNAPVLYETMIFGSVEHKDYQERYHDLEESMLGHERAVSLVRQTLDERYSGLRGLWWFISEWFIKLV